MKVAIITLTDGQNYGNRLQNYALQKTLTELGAEVQTLNHYTYKDQKGIKRFKKISKDFIKLFLKSYKHKRLRVKRFKRFKKNYSFYSKISLHDNYLILDLKDKYDYFVVGSDQVWNAGFRIVSDDILNYLLFFADNKQRIAYAASFGTEKIPTGYEKYFKNELPKFKAISVRENSGKKIVAECGSTATVVLDPTLLVDAEHWKKIARKPTYVSDAPFVVTYFLGGRDAELNEYISKIASDKIVYNLEIETAQINAIDSVEVFATAPDEFVWLISHAEIILTDSFHATVFSILFHKPFCVFERKATYECYKMGSRLDTLLEMFHLEKYRDAQKSFSIIPETYETTEIDHILNIEREKSISFLKNALSNQELM